MPSVYSRPATEIIVYVNGNENKNLRVLSISDGCGANALPRARLQLRIQDPTTSDLLTSLNKFFTEIEILFRAGDAPVAGDPTAAARERIAFWGTLSGKSLAIGRDESLSFEARTSPRHFGLAVTGPLEYNPANGKCEILHQAIEFNPTVSFSGALGQRIQNSRGIGFVRGNMSTTRTFGKGSARAFLDPARVFTKQARKHNDGEPETSQVAANQAKFLATDRFWTLSEAVYYLCWSLNAAETFFKNPTRSELKLLDDSKDLLRDVVVPMGTFLPEALDLVLQPFGFGWRIDYRGRGDRGIAVFRRGAGTETSVKLQSPREELDPKKTNVEACHFGVGNESLVNEVYVYGARKLVESTFELKRAWSKEYDGVDMLQLNAGNVDWKDKPQYHRVWRDWVLNEGGDYIGVRSDYKQPHDLDGILGEKPVPRRRRFFPCITLDKDRLPVGQNGYFVEFYNGFEWLPVERLTNGSYEVLTNECGIRFTGVAPPQELVFAGDSAKIRITASVYSDDRLTGWAHRDFDSILTEVNPVVIDAEGSFHHRTIHDSSQFWEQVQAKKYEHSQVDDTDKIQAHARKLCDAWDQADASGSITIPDLDEVYELGTVIRAIEGRGIQLEIGSRVGKRYPQIVAREFDVPLQKQILTVESMRDMRLM